MSLCSPPLTTRNSQFSLLHFPSLEPAAEPIKLEKGEIYDASFAPTHVRLMDGTVTLNSS